jgi:hypothetical protein
MSTVLLQNTGGFELNDGWRISSVLVGIDYPRRGMLLPAQGFGQNQEKHPANLSRSACKVATLPPH